MTAWTAIVIPLFIFAKCDLDFIGMEYGSEFQCMSDTAIRFIFITILLSTFITDFINAFYGRK